MIDAHCHLDAYPDPYRTALAVERSRVLTIAVTNLPSAFEAAYPHVRGLRYIRLAIGLHPLFAERHGAERRRFVAALDHTSYVGEVGLDFSREGLPTRDQQLASFRFVLEQVRRRPKWCSHQVYRTFAVWASPLRRRGRWRRRRPQMKGWRWAFQYTVA